MRNIFLKKNNILKKFQFQSFFIVTIIFILLLFIYSITLLGKKNDERQRIELEKNLRKNIVHCYAVEGTYPPNLTYLQEHYGFYYDKNRFFIDYNSIGSNLIPDITIIDKEENDDISN